jgi:Fe-Mn family superoxide dismutase
MDPDELAISADRALAMPGLRLDVRRAAAYDADDAMIAGASWRDPDRVAHWGPALAGTGVRECLVYCVHGHEVGRNTAARLRALGVRAHYLVGGIEGWKQAGLPLQRKEEMP